MSVKPSASRTEEGARETGKGLVARTWRRSKAVGEGSVVWMGQRGRQLLVFHTPCIGDADEGTNANVFA